MAPLDRRNNALSLVEVLVAVAIVAVVFVPVFNLFMQGVTATKYTEDRQRAFSIAKRQIESIRHANKIDRKSHSLVTADFVNSPGFIPYTVDNRYKVTTVIDPDFEVSENGVQAKLSSVEVKVEWEITGSERSLVLETYIDRAYN